MTNNKPDNSKEQYGNNWCFDTRSVHGAGEMRSQYGETSEALYLTSSYVYPSPEEAEKRFKVEAEGYIYSRYGNPTVSMFEERMRLLEGAEAAMATSSGMAAVNAVFMSQLSSGDHILAAKALFGASLYLLNELLPRLGVETTLVDGGDLDAWQAGIRANTKLVFLETPTNPTLDLIDLKKVADIAHSVGAKLVVDNVFATPILQQPFKFGADIVLYSATKHIDGQGRCLGGIVLGSKDYIGGDFREYVRQTGPSLSPFNAWVMLKGLETLSLRVRQHGKNAAKVADFLGEHKSIARVIYPGRTDHPHYELHKKQMGGGGPLVAFEIKGGKREAFAFMNKLSIIKICNNLGDAKSLITHPTTTTHQRLSDEERSELGITPALMRLSVGLEDAQDLIEDLVQALGARE
ncbi:MAG: O-succinylhomoserine sulfhydrylase [bacterium]|nr:O-succinylhomoserine sulfhydrylase [bacterium]